MSAAERTTARWVGGLFLVVVLFQRFGVPGAPYVGMLLLLVLVWAAAAAARGIVMFDGTRLVCWFAAATITAGMMLVENRFVVGADISIPAWALVMAVWFPFTVRVKENSSAAYLAMLGYVAKIATGLSLLSISMVGTQLVGITYRDWFGDFVPQAFQLGGFNTTAPVIYGSPYFRGNGWIGLEPSMVSLQLGVGLLAALYVRARVRVVIVLILGLISTVSGSGILIVGVGLLVMLLHRSRGLLTRYAVLGTATIVAAAFTPFGQLLLGRSTEIGSGDSSASLRALQPYSVLVPRWIEHLPGMVFGYGPGSSQRVVAQSNILGLLVPSPAKVFFEYGLIGGLVLAAFILGCYWGGPSRALGLTLLFSLWALQPGITTSAVVTPLLVLVTLWSPRNGPPIESLVAKQTPKAKLRPAPVLVSESPGGAIEAGRR